MGLNRELRPLRVVNCTPHVIHLLDADSYMYRQVKPTIKITFPTSEYVARVDYNTRLLEKIIVGNTVVDITTTRYLEVQGLPEPEEGTILLVSKLVAEALHGKRDDLYILSGFSRDSAGKVLGGRSLAKLNPIFHE